ncbi:hypothetical protein HJA85_27210 [Rhizobium bangladeshense]|uniref:hypothetical protein n=1 Tax=Rhizobium bangladeshense TaxID=1138189 RepID=UPI001C8317E6|nr:hypothetical protein [Rhizobium bangladeshense]MBX4870613.1 hypothetical protein [Rhizobium bangladeshense]MBX4872672.1 hypothetical protein [Rhizobium bangladeshense]
MVKKRKSSLGPLVSPQAIMWRPIKYFSQDVRDDEDELDRFKYIGYVDNNFPFDLRTYLGHPPKTVTLYLPSEINTDAVIQERIDRAIKVLDVPESALAWRRGEQIHFGQLERSPEDRLREKEAGALMIKILGSLPDGRASTKKIKDMVPEFYDLSEADLQRSPSRKNEQIWRQIIGNVKVHRAGASSIFSRGFVREVPGGVSLTAKGLAYLKSIGFSSD